MNNCVRNNCEPSEPSKLSTSSTFTSTANNPNAVTDSESTNKGGNVSDVHYIASSVANSFSDKLEPKVEEIIVKQSAKSLPIIPMGEIVAENNDVPTTNLIGLLSF